MSGKEDTNSKIESDAADRYCADIGASKTGPVYSAVMFGINWQKEHCYTEQEVIVILETFRARIINSADTIVSGRTAFAIIVDKQSILSVDYTDLLKTPPVK